MSEEKKKTDGDIFHPPILYRTRVRNQIRKIRRYKKKKNVMTIPENNNTMEKIIRTG